MCAFNPSCDARSQLVATSGDKVAVGCKVLTGDFLGLWQCSESASSVDAQYMCLSRLCRGILEI